jgi:hypothetical protein
MTQLILDRSKHRTRLPRIFAIASRNIDVGLIAGQGSSRQEQVPRNPFYLSDAKPSPKKSAARSLLRVLIQIHERKNTVAFKTPRVSKKTPLLIVEQTLLCELSHQLNHLARLFSAGTPVAE